MRKWLVVGVLVLSISTPWAFLQSVAWFGMLVTYSRQTTITQAVSMTFDGSHPCRLCHLVKEGRAKERQQEKKSVSQDLKMQLGLPPSCLFLVHTPIQQCFVRTGYPSSSRSEPPPTPPPRFS